MAPTTDFLSLKKCVTNAVVTENTEDNSASTTLIHTTTNPDTPDVLLPVSQVTPADLSMSTTSVSTTLTSSPYYSSELKKRKFQKLKKEQEAIMGAILKEKRPKPRTLETT